MFGRTIVCIYDEKAEQKEYLERRKQRQNNYNRKNRQYSSNESDNFDSDEDTDNSRKTYRRRQYKQHKTQNKTTHKNFKPKQNNRKQQHTMSKHPKTTSKTIQTFRIQLTKTKLPHPTSHIQKIKMSKKTLQPRKTTPNKESSHNNQTPNQNIHRRITHNTTNTIVT